MFTMNIFFVILSLVVSECNTYDGNYVPVTTAKETSGWPVINGLVMDLLNQRSFRPTTTTEYELPQTNSDTTGTTDPKILDGLISQLFGKPDPEPVGSSPQLSSNPEVETTLTNRPTPSLIPFSQIANHHINPSSNENIGSPLIPNYLQSYHYPSNNVQYSQPPASQHELPPLFPQITQGIPEPYNPPSFYNPSNWLSTLNSSKIQSPYYSPSYIPDAIPAYPSYSLPYQSSVIPVVMVSHLPQVHNVPLINYDPFLQLNAQTGGNSGPSQSPSILNYPLQNYGIPGYIIFRPYTPQHQYQPSQSQVSLPPAMSYGPPAPQLSEEGIFPLIQNSQASSSPDASSSSMFPPPFPFVTGGNKPNFASVPSSSGKLSNSYSSSQTGPLVPRFPYYREPRASGSDGYSPVSISEGLQPKSSYYNPSNLYFS